MPASNEQIDKAQQLLAEAADAIEDSDGVVAREQAQTKALVALGYAVVGAAKLYAKAGAQDA
jgi:hypothetical protein